MTTTDIQQFTKTQQTKQTNKTTTCETTVSQQLNIETNDWKIKCEKQNKNQKQNLKQVPLGGFVNEQIKTLRTQEKHKNLQQLLSGGFVNKPIQHFWYLLGNI